MTTEPPIPEKLEPIGATGLRIIWNDGLACDIPWILLRKACPCAACREEIQKPADPLRVLKPSELLPLKPVRFSPVGHYGYKVDWSDGHSTGIYSIGLLRDICLATNSAAPGGSNH